MGVAVMSWCQARSLPSLRRSAATDETHTSPAELVYDSKYGGVFRGLRLPLSADHNFYDSIFSCFTNFFLQNIKIQALINK